jgi:hypothetical protein
VERVIKWIAKLPCYSLRYGDTDEAIAVVSRIFPRLRDTNTLSTTS